VESYKALLSVEKALLRCASLSAFPLTLGEIGVVCCSVSGADYDSAFLSVEKTRIHSVEKTRLKTIVVVPIRCAENKWELKQFQQQYLLEWSLLKTNAIQEKAIPY